MADKIELTLDEQIAILRSSLEEGQAELAGLEAQRDLKSQSFNLAFRANGRTWTAYVLTKDGRPIGVHSGVQPSRAEALRALLALVGIEE